MISKKMEAALNAQLQKELYSGHLYLAMSAYFESINLPGFAHWMRVQAHEEQKHALKIYGYINDQAARIIVEGLDKPQSEWKSPLAAMEATLKHEQFITSSLGEIMTLAVAEKDYATQGLMQWYLTEQVEEEKSPLDIINQLKMINEAPQGLIMLDRALAQRGK